MPLQTRRCEICGGSGFTVRQVNGYDCATTCSCRRQGHMDRKLAAALLPPRYDHCQLENYEIHHATQMEARQRAVDFVASYPPAAPTGLLFSGPCGVGKTHLAAGILRNLIQQKGVDGHFVDFRELLKNIQDTYRPSHPLSPSQIVRPILEVELLVLDDLGAAKMTDWVRDTLGHIISHRYNQERITLFTTHFRDGEAAAAGTLDVAPETLAVRIGTALRSRLDEMCRVVPMEGHDYRRSFLRAADRW